MLHPDTYEKLNWGENLYRIGVIGDGNCLYHAILLATNNDYLVCSKDDRIQTVRNLREELPSRITIKQFADYVYKNVPREVSKYQDLEFEMTESERNRLEEQLEHLCYHEPFSSYNEKQLSLFLRQFLGFCEYLRNHNEYLGDDVTILLSHLMNIDIYITSQLEQSHTFVYNDPEQAYKSRPSIILYHNHNHWEVIGRGMSNGIQTCFDPEDYFIRQLRKHNEDCWNKLHKK